MSRGRRSFSVMNRRQRMLAGGAAVPVPQAPDAIDDLAVTATGSGQITLGWTAPANNGSAIDDYRLLYRLHGAPDWSVFADGVSATPGGTVTGLTDDLPAPAYDFGAQAHNAGGWSAVSNVVTGTPVSVAPATLVKPLLSFNAVTEALSVTNDGDQPDGADYRVYDDLGNLVQSSGASFTTVDGKAYYFVAYLGADTSDPSDMYAPSNDALIVGTDFLTGITDGTDLTSIVLQGARQFVGSSGQYKTSGGELVRYASGSVFNRLNVGTPWMRVEYDVLADDGAVFDDAGLQPHTVRIGFNGSDTPPGVQILYKSGNLSLGAYNGSWGTPVGADTDPGSSWGTALQHRTRVAFEIYPHADTNNYVRIWRDGVNVLSAQNGGKGFKVGNLMASAGNIFEYGRNFTPSVPPNTYVMDNLRITQTNVLPFRLDGYSVTAPVGLAGPTVNLALVYRGAGTPTSFDVWLKDINGKVVSSIENVLAANLGAVSIEVNQGAMATKDLYVDVRNHADSTVCATFFVCTMTAYMVPTPAADQIFALNIQNDLYFRDLAKQMNFSFVNNATGTLNSENADPNNFNALRIPKDSWPAGTDYVRAIIGGGISNPFGAGVVHRVTGLTGATYTARWDIASGFELVAGSVTSDGFDFVTTSNATVSLYLDFTVKPTGGWAGISILPQLTTEQAAALPATTVASPWFAKRFSRANAGFNGLRTIKETGGEHLAEVRSDGVYVGASRVDDGALMAALCVDLGYRWCHWSYAVDMADAAKLTWKNAFFTVAGTSVVLGAQPGNEILWNYGYGPQNDWLIAQGTARGFSGSDADKGYRMGYVLCREDAILFDDARVEMIRDIQLGSSPEEIKARLLYEDENGNAVTDYITWIMATHYDGAGLTYNDATIAAYPWFDDHTTDQPGWVSGYNTLRGTQAGETIAGNRAIADMLAQFYPGKKFGTYEGGFNDVLLPKAATAGPSMVSAASGLVAAMIAAKRAAGRYTIEAARIDAQINAGFACSTEFVSTETVHHYGDDNWGGVNGFGILTRLDGDLSTEQRYQAILAKTAEFGMRGV